VARSHRQIRTIKNVPDLLAMAQVEHKVCFLTFEMKEKWEQRHSGWRESCVLVDNIYSMASKLT
jgi:hypothetical protein